MIDVHGLQKCLGGVCQRMAWVSPHYPHQWDLTAHDPIAHSSRFLSWTTLTGSDHCSFETLWPSHQGQRSQGKLKTKNQQEAVLTAVEGGLVVALPQSLLGLSIRGRRCIRGSGLIIGLPWLDGISSVTSETLWALLPLYKPTGRAAAPSHLKTHTSRWQANDQFLRWQK